MRIAVTGSGGLVGSHLVRWLRGRGYEVFPIQRSGHGPLRWSPDGPVDLELPGGQALDAVVHLAGAPIAGQRWTSAYKREIEHSRVAGTQRLVDGLSVLQDSPPVLISASAVAVYGPGCGDAELAETEWDLDGAHGDYLTDVARGWERSAANYHAGRVVRLRLGIVLSPEGGALEKMVPPFKWGVGGPLGSGQQWMSWVELNDVVRAIGFALDTPDFDGPANLVAPDAVRNKDFSKTLGRVLRRPSWAPVPRFALRLVAGELADAALLVSHRAVPERLTEAGFVFEGRDLETVLRRVLG